MPRTSNIGFGGLGYKPILEDKHMPLGIVSEEDFLNELGNIGRIDSIDSNDSNDKSDDNSCALVITPKSPGRRNGDVEVPESLRKIIGEDKIDGVIARELADAYNVSPASISAYAKGATSTATYNKPDPDLKRHVVNKKEKLLNKASKRLSLALDGITPEKLQAADLRDSAAVARDMSVIMKNLEPKEDESARGTNIQYNFFVPPMKKESDYESIVVVDAE